MAFTIYHFSLFFYRDNALIARAVGYYHIKWTGGGGRGRGCSSEIKKMGHQDSALWTWHEIFSPPLLAGQVVLMFRLGLSSRI